MAALVYTTVGGNNYRALSDPVPSVDLAGFDMVEMRVLFNGSISQLLTRFSLGSLNTLPSPPAGSKLYCIGPQGGTEHKYGHIWATIAWKGFLDGTGKRSGGQSYTLSTRETQFPQSGVRPNGSIYAVAAGTPYAPGLINPKTGANYRVRIIEMVGGLRMQGVYIGSPSRRPPIPTVPANVQKPVSGVPNLSASLPDPLYSYPSGWVCRNFETNSEYTLGEVTLYFWTAYFEFVERASP